MMTRPRPHQPDHLTFSGVVADGTTCYRRRQVFQATKGAHMLRGLATVNYWADDLEAAKEWYSELLGSEPYFERAELDGRIVAPETPATTRRGRDISSFDSATTSTSWA